MERRDISPWSWSVEMGFPAAVEVRGVERTLYCSGQTSVDENGAVLHPGDLLAQFEQALANLEKVLGDAGMAPSNVVRFNLYLTDVDALFAVFEPVKKLVTDAGIFASGTVAGVERLGFPGIVVEMEATAVA